MKKHTDRNLVGAEGRDLQTIQSLVFSQLMDIAGVDTPDGLQAEFYAEYEKLPDIEEDSASLNDIRNMISIYCDENKEFPEHLLLELYSFLRTRIIMQRFVRKYIPNAGEIPEFEGSITGTIPAHTPEEWANRSVKVRWEDNGCS